MREKSCWIRIFIWPARQTSWSLLRTVRENAETVMIIGHNPGLEELVGQLTGEWQDLPTAALAHIVLEIDQWRDLKLSTRGTLLGHWRPKELT